jgi:hypothetical protein
VTPRRLALGFLPAAIAVAALAGLAGLAGCPGEESAASALGDASLDTVATSPSDAAGDGGPAPTCVPDAGGKTTFRLEPDKVLVPSFVGFGAELNQNVYAAISADAGVTASNVKDMESKLTSLAPQHVRVFFDSKALTDPDLMQSFVRTVQLGQAVGASINVTYWHGPYPDPSGQMQAFVDVLSDLVNTKGLTAVKYVTVQNEVNSTAITMPDYEAIYRALDADLRAAGLRGRIQIVGGDLLATNQAAWFAYLADHMSDVLDGYSVHIYWDYTDTAKLVSRLTEVRAILDGLPIGARKPLYVTEFGVRGVTATGEPDPGHIADGRPIGDTNLNAFQHAWFDLVAARLGYVATVKWDAYAAKYDNGSQNYAMISAPKAGAWPLTPVYHLTRMLTHAVRPGWHGVDVSGQQAGVLVAGYALDREAAVLLMSTQGKAMTTTIGGLPAGRTLHVLVWNRDGAGEFVEEKTLTTEDRCTATVSAPAGSVVALTTLE